MKKKIPAGLKKQIKKLRDYPKERTESRFRDILFKLRKIDEKHFLSFALNQFTDNLLLGKAIVSNIDISWQPISMQLMCKCRYTAIWREVFDKVIQNNWNTKNLKEFLKKHLAHFPKDEDLTTLKDTLLTHGYDVGDCFT